MNSEQITSKNNPRVKGIRKLRARGERDRTGTFFVEGIRQVVEAVQSDFEVIELIVASELLRSELALNMLDEQAHQGSAVMDVTGEVFASISDRDHPQGLAAVVRQRQPALSDLEVTDSGIWVALESISDPGNLGTILRTADAVGVSGVVLVGQSTDPYDPTVVRASMGALFTQPVVRTSAVELLDWAQTNQIGIAGTSPAATMDYSETDYPSPLLLLMGSERHGLSQRLLDSCDHLVRLPMVGRVDSLNLAVSTGVMLYEIFHRRRAAKSEQRVPGKPTV